MGQVFDTCDRTCGNLEFFGPSASYNSHVKLLGQTELRTIELPHQLQFNLVSTNGWMDTLGVPAIALSLLFASWKWHFWPFLAFASLILAYVVADRAHGSVAQICVTADAITAKGNLGQLSTTEITRTSSEIESIGYFAGGEDGTPGLYINQRTLLLRLNEKDATEITNSIRQKFPLLEQGDTSPNSLFFGEQSEVLTLGLGRHHSSQTSDRE